MVDQLFSALLFYLIFSLFAVVGLPITGRCIGNKYLAYVSSKPVGFAIFGYCVWLLCGFRVLDYQDHKRIYVLLAIFLALCVFLYRRFKSPTLNTPLPTVREILKVECVSLAVYFVYLLLRSHNPNGGSERMMDIALLAAAGKTDFFPFIDPWYAGKTVNYYYYGQYLLSLLGNLSRTASDIAYNLSLTLIYTESVVLSAALVYAITKRKRTSALAAYMITTAGALYYAWRVVKDVYFQHKTLSLFTSTHFYDPSYTIREIPSYSFTVGDLHAHVIALPFFLLGLIFIYALVGSAKPRAVIAAAMIPLFATSGLINGWDIITLFTLTGIACLIKYWTITKASRLLVKGDKSGLPKIDLKWIAAPCVIAAGTVLLMLPFIMNLHSPVMGIGFSPAFVIGNHLENVQYPTSPLAFLGLWGIFAACFALLWKVSRDAIRENAFISALAACGILIVVGMELFFVRDIYSIANPPYFRSNTTFKFGFHAWAILCIAFAVWMEKIRSISPRSERSGRSRSSGQSRSHWRFSPRLIARIIIVTAAVGGAFYPIHAVQDYYLGNKNEQTLSVAQWMQWQEPGDYAVVDYINRAMRVRKVIAEAVGDSYTNHARIASYTGMITPMGWMTHEWTWRFHLPAEGSNDTGWDAVAAVSGDIRALYETSDSAEALRVIEKYNIDYVYAGKMERAAYPNLQEEKFTRLGSLVFETDGGRLYEIRDNHGL